jgi:hypothetical protein
MVLPECVAECMVLELSFLFGSPGRLWGNHSSGAHCLSRRVARWNRVQEDVERPMVEVVWVVQGLQALGDRFPVPNLGVDVHRGAPVHPFREGEFDLEK